MMIQCYDGDGVSEDDREHEFWNNVPVCSFDCLTLQDNGDHRYAFDFGDEIQDIIIEYELMDFIGKPARLLVSCRSRIAVGDQPTTVTYCIQGYVRSVRSRKGLLHVKCAP